MKFTICNDCPCLNEDYENGAECNLKYTSEYHQLAKYGWCQCSTDCRLRQINCQHETLRMLEDKLNREVVEDELVPYKRSSCSSVNMDIFDTLQTKLYNEAIKKDVFVDSIYMEIKEKK